MQPNPRLEDLREGSLAWGTALIFANAYTRLLGLLHRTFNGELDSFERAVALMYELRLAARRVLEVPLPGWPDVSTGLPFCYQPEL